MKLEDFNKLKKFMQLAMSDNDNEALAALKKANGILRVNGVDWQRVFDRCVQIEVAVEEAPDDSMTMGRANTDQINGAFEEIEKNNKFTPFIQSLNDQWVRKRSLSPKQQDALFRVQRDSRE